MSVALVDYDLDRLQALQRARWRATALLVGVAVAFVGTFFLGEAPWVGFLRTTAEASLIGGLADWFAVTALFRHPLGLPIPHTAIIPRSKTGLARSLGEFVEHNFLSPDQLVERLEAARLPKRFGEWLAREGNADTLAGHVFTTLGAVAFTPRADQDGVLGELVDSLPLARWAGRALQTAIEERRHEALVAGGIAGILSLLEENRGTLREWVSRESPWWVPEAVDEAVFNRGWEALHRLVREVENDPDHAVREGIDRRLLDLGRRLQTDPDFARGLNVRLAEMVRQAGGFDGVWASLADQLREAGRSTDSRLRRRLVNALQGWGARLAGDEDLQEEMEAWLRSLTGPLSRVGQRELGDLIALTVERWDPADTSRRLELWMGRDLQFVRINGTVVGGLAGLAIHTAVVLVT